MVSISEAKTSTCFSTMEWSWTVYVCFFFVISQCNNGCFGCLEEERVALLELKSSMNISRTDPHHLSTWIDDKGSDCCAWERVRCHNTTRRVIHLSLDSLNLDDYEVFLNASLFLPFEQLQYLDISFNGFGGWQKNEGPEKLSKLKKLEVLDLNFNKFGYNILQPWDLSNMSKLKFLDMGSNQFSGSIPPSIWSLKSLEIFSIEDNNFRGSISGLCDLKNLRVVNLARNQLQGIVPPCLSNLTSLTGLDLSRNQLTGIIPLSFITNLTSLKSIYLSENNFDQSSSFTFVSLPNPKFQLTDFHLSNCNINASTSDLLKFLHTQYNLTSVALSHNKLHGNFPSWLVENNTRLEFLSLKNNSVNGHIRLPAIHNLDRLDLSDNHLQGKLQTNIGGHLTKLNLSHNFLEGRIPPLALGTSEDLDLSNNNFSGEIPHNIGINASIMELRLSNNQLGGSLSFLWNLTQLQYLRVNNNQFTGTIAIPNSYYLQIFDASQNRLSGRIPAQIGNLTDLQLFFLRDNLFDGPIPQELCKLPYLRLLDLSKNQFLGSIPSGLNLSSLRYMQLRENKLTGMIPKALLRSRDRIVTLDLSNNNLSGRIPKWLGLLSQLRLLLLKDNHFSGSIPHKFCQLNKIGVLDLSHNSFSGSIPPCFGNFTFGNSGVDDEHQFGDSQWDIDIVAESFLDENFGYLSPEEVELVTKNRLNLYKGDILNYMAGMDLSCNQFTGNIPVELGALKAIHALNLSHNQLTGSIPKTFSNMKQLESMDLSHNSLSGEIPSELIDITNLEVFLAAHNNLSGRIPDMKAQFSTFGETSYEGNPFLCGAAVQKPCDKGNTVSGTPTVAKSSEKFGIDPISFLASFSASYVMSLLAFVIVLYINPYWRRIWFDFIDSCLSFMFPFWSEAIYR